MRWFYCGLVLLFPLAFGLAQSKILIQPLDFQENDQHQAPEIRRILQLETMNDQIVIRSSDDHLVIVDRTGRWLGNIGPINQGSEAFQLTSGFAIWGDRVVMLNRKQSLFFYLEDGSSHYATTDYFAAGALAPILNSNQFGFDGERIVFSARPRSGKVAVVHNSKGELLHQFGEPEPFSKELMAVHPVANATFWAWDGKFWYCLYKFKPLLKQYDSHFNLVKTLELVSDEISDMEQRLYELTDDQKAGRQAIPPHFSDFKVFGDHLYTMCGNALYKIDKSLEGIQNTYYFFGKGPEFSALDRNLRLTLPYFTFLSNGTMVLAHPANMWDHDMWTAHLPGLTQPTASTTKVNGR